MTPMTPLKYSFQNEALKNEILRGKGINNDLGQLDEKLENHEGLMLINCGTNADSTLFDPPTEILDFQFEQAIG
jgi:hypothetical protein